MTESATSDRPATRGDGGSPEGAQRIPVWEDFIDIFYAPAAVYARRESGSFWVPMVVVAILLGLAFSASFGELQGMMDAEFRRASATAMKANPQITPEMMEKGRAFGEVASKIGAFFFPPIAVFFSALALWLVGKLMEARQTFHAALVVAAYAYVPKVVEAVLTALQALMMDASRLDGRYRLTLGLGRFLDPETTSPILLALIGRVDVFTLWVTVLLAIGLAVTGRIGRARAAIAGAMVWVIGALPGVFAALRR